MPAGSTSITMVVSSSPTLADLLNGIDAVVGQLTDMHKSVHAGQQVDKGAVGFDSHNLPGVDFAYFDLFCQGFNFAASLFGRGTVFAQR